MIYIFNVLANSSARISLFKNHVNIADKQHTYLWSTEKSLGNGSSESMLSHYENTCFEFDIFEIAAYIVCVYLDAKTPEQEPIVTENLSSQDLNLVQIGVTL